MKASLERAGKAAEKPFRFHHPRGGEPLDVLLRPISQDEEAAAIEYAMNFAKSRGVAEPDSGSKLFEIGYRCFVASVATIDPDSDPKAREPSFESPEFLNKEYHPDSIVYLHGAWKVHQDECSPLTTLKTPKQLIACTKAMAADDDDFSFFLQLPPLMQAILSRFTARLALSSPAIKSFDSLSTGTADNS